MMSTTEGESHAASSSTRSQTQPFLGPGQMQLFRVNGTTVVTEIGLGYDATMRDIWTLPCGW